MAKCPLSDACAGRGTRLGKRWVRCEVGPARPVAVRVRLGCRLLSERDVAGELSEGGFRNRHQLEGRRRYANAVRPRPSGRRSTRATSGSRWCGPSACQAVGKLDGRLVRGKGMKEPA